MLDDTVRRHADSRAFVDGDREVTWSEFAAIVESTARGIAGQGVQSGDRVALLAGNGIPLTAAYWAIWRVGAIAVPLNHRLTASDLAKQLESSSPRLLLVGCGKEELGRVAAATSEINVVLQGEDDHFLSSSVGAGYTTPAMGESTPAAILFTSGTTGRAKGVVISHGNAVQNSVTCTSVIGRRDDDIELVMVPQFNVTGLCSQTVPIVHLGMCGVLLDGFSAERAVELARAHQVTSTVGAPTMWWRILESAGAKGLPGLRLALYGGAPMPTALLERMTAIFGSATFGNGYGMTETCSMVTYLGGDDAVGHSESVGQPLPITEMRLLELTAPRDVEGGQVGEVTVRGPQVAIGYWVDGEVSPIVDSDGWLRTGDVARLVDGFVVLADRIKDVIKRGGESIFSIEVEEVLHQYPAVLEAAVVGVPDDVYGEIVLAAVVVKPGVQTDPGDIRAFCQLHLAPFKVPSSVEIVDELPRNAGGKVIKARLKEMFSQRSSAVARD